MGKGLKATTALFLCLQVSEYSLSRFARTPSGLTFLDSEYSLSRFARDFILLLHLSTGAHARFFRFISLLYSARCARLNENENDNHSHLEAVAHSPPFSFWVVSENYPSDLILVSSFRHEIANHNEVVNVRSLERHKIKQVRIARDVADQFFFAWFFVHSGYPPIFKIK